MSSYGAAITIKWEGGCRGNRVSHQLGYKVSTKERKVLWLLSLSWPWCMDMAGKIQNWGMIRMVIPITYYLQHIVKIEKAKQWHQRGNNSTNELEKKVQKLTQTNTRILYVISNFKINRVFRKNERSITIWNKFWAN